MFTIDWAEVRRRAFRTFFQVLAAVLAYLMVALPVVGTEAFSWAGLAAAALAPVAGFIAFIQNWWDESKATNELNAKVK